MCSRRCMNIGGVSVRCTVVYRCPPFQNLYFYRTFFLDFGEFPRRFDETDAIPAPRLVVTQKAITPACLPAPSYPWTTPQHSLRQHSYPAQQHETVQSYSYSWLDIPTSILFAHIDTILLIAMLFVLHVSNLIVNINGFVSLVDLIIRVYI